ncbi:MAG TPA: hypothetical protein VE986_02730, partial [Hyphomicrobiales bacterium]|nr:hypothetical protein [Hyphomicrobiales bacterium]
KEAAMSALSISRDTCRAYAEQFSWSACAGRFRDIIVEANRQEPTVEAISQRETAFLRYDAGATADGS